MAGNVQSDTDDKIRAEMLKQAYVKAAAIISGRTPLTASAALAIGPAVVDAVTPAIRAEHRQQLTGHGASQAVKVGAVALGALALDVTVFAVMATRGPRWVRPLAAASALLHVGLVTYSKRSTARVRAAARVETARGNIRSAA